MKAPPETVTRYAVFVPYSSDVPQLGRYEFVRRGPKTWRPADGSRHGALGYRVVFSEPLPGFETEHEAIENFIRGLEKDITYKERTLAYLRHQLGLGECMLRDLLTRSMPT